MVTHEPAFFGKENLKKKGWEKVPTWECLSVHKKLGLFFSVHVDGIQIDLKEAKHGFHVENSAKRNRP